MPTPLPGIAFIAIITIGWFVSRNAPSKARRAFIWGAVFTAISCSAALTRVGRTIENDYLDALIREQNKTLPVTVGGVSVTRIERKGTDIIYTNYVSCCEASEIKDNEELKQIFESSMATTIKLVCGMEASKRAFANDLNIAYKYYGSNWKLIDAIKISKSDCR